MSEAKTGGNVDIAVIGMSCHFPGAKTPDEYWQLLVRGEETVKHFTEQELLERGVGSGLIKDKNFVPVTSTIYDYELFDANFFSYNPREATYMDPQHRIFLQCCWSAFEDAGYIPNESESAVAVFAGLGMNTYIPEVLMKNKSYLNSITTQEIMLGNDKDFLTSQVSYKLNLTGPCVNVNTACSTSLVAIHLARQSLLLHECDMALAGAVSILLSTRNGYLYVQDSILSPDGRCRPFDAGAKGTLWGDGCGVVLLKRLADALGDGDHIHAVIKGSAVNNDGALKAGFTAPSAEGQANVITEALADADLDAQDIRFVEAHGTGTILGDPIEIEALNQAFALDKSHNNTCAIGSVKSNMGHLNAAAGIAGFIKSVLALKHRQLPPSLHYRQANPNIDFSAGPFFVNTELLALNGEDVPIRAGLNAMGLGGTNAHIILEEAPRRESTAASSTEEVLLVSAQSSTALEAICTKLADYLEAHTELSLGDVAYTLACGRAAMKVRKAIRSRDVAQTAKTLRILGRGDTSADEIITDETYVTEKLSDASAWLRGEARYWLKYFQNHRYQRLALPTYAFQGQRYWVDPDKSEVDDDYDFYYTKQDNMASWFYVPSWNHKPLSFSNLQQPSKCWLVFADESTLATQLIESLSQGEGSKVVCVSVGESFAQPQGLNFEVNPLSREDFNTLSLRLEQEDLLPDAILFLWSLETRVFEGTPASFEKAGLAQQRGLPSVMHLIQTLVAKVADKVVDLFALTNRTFDVSGSEEISVLHSGLQGICMVIQQEYSNFTCRVFDVDLATPKPFDALLSEAIIREIFSDETHLVTAFRNGKRYLRKYEPLRIEEQAPRFHGVRPDGLYLCYGGLEGIGFLISENIVKQQGAKILLLEDDDMPEIDQWNNYLAKHDDGDAISIRIINAQDLLNYDTVAYIGSLNDLFENEKRIEDIQRKFGTINGVLHAPGASNYRRIKSIKDLSFEQWCIQFDKVAWSLVKIDHVFRDSELEFRIMLNSLGSVIGGPGFVSIASASNFAKTFAALQRRQGKPLWAIQCWDSWVIEWGQAKENMPAKMYERVFPSVLTHEEGLQCFYRLFSSKDIVEMDISASDLGKRYRKWVELDSSLRNEGVVETGQNKQPRPDIGVTHREPQNALHKELGQLFGDTLSIDDIGIDDSFFDLGGNSLLAIQLTAKLRQRYAIDVDLYRLLEFRTIDKLAGFIQKTLRAG